MFSESFLKLVENTMFTRGIEESCLPNATVCNVCIFTIVQGHGYSTSAAFGYMQLELNHTRKRMITNNAEVGCISPTDLYEKTQYLWHSQVNHSYIHWRGSHQSSPTQHSLFALHRIDALLHEKNGGHFKDQLSVLKQRLGAYLYALTAPVV